MNEPLEAQTNKTTQTVPHMVTGSDIMTYSQEAMQEKRLTIAAIIDKINANNVVGEIVDDYEKERIQLVARQKEQVSKEQLEKEAKIRKELEEKRLLEEEQALKEESASFLSLITKFAEKAKTKLSDTGLIEKFLKRHENQQEEPEEKEPVVEEPQEKEPVVEKPQEKDIIPLEKKTKTKPKKEKEPKKAISKPTKKKSPTSSKTVSISFAEDVVDEVIEESDTEEPPIPPKKAPEEIKTEIDTKREALRNDIIRTHESTTIDEVYRFRLALERLSEDSYNRTYVCAACIIDKDFESISVIRDVVTLAELIADSGDSLDFYFAYIVTNKGVQHYGCDEAISDVSLAMEDIRKLFMQNKGKVTPQQLQSLNSLRIFKTIYYEDSTPHTRR